ncbi:hydantoinase/oxoprolinase family protein [Thalassotalea psychrophila]|uniref:Hydantoinase/oxoprolinase family protein n=1 Tax=Thalassotalea psychrophila TaxID=3065647 RepID=A0ABY9TZ64_9GAMM|nr:hydantoinase/oxoprolinase family protein [Colwelliaceae bacterium SQ149]
MNNNHSKIIENDNMGKLINIDNGGTLTDIWVLDGDKSYHTKTITTPYDLSKCFYEGLKKVSGVIYGEDDLAALLQSTDHIRYSTTQGTNALVMKKGPRLGLIIDKKTKLEDLLSTDKEAEMFPALVGDRVEQIDNNLTGDAYSHALSAAINRLSSDGANRIVVSFSGDDYLKKEASFRSLSFKLFPRHLLGAVPLLYAGSLSSDQNALRRTWTAINNAFLHPAMEQFLFNADNKLREFRMTNPLLIYRNDGYAGRVAKTVALKTYSSGPRAGMDSAKAYAEYYGFNKFLTFDVGGTTTDIGLIEDDVVKAFSHGEVEGVECSFPLCDIKSIGVGGGSIFRVKDGSITVGPDSVGGAPGPACFGMGGKEATITDALLLMGLLDPETYFGGEMKLDADRSRAIIAENIAEPLGITVNQAIHDMLKAWAGDIATGLSNYTELTDDTVLSAFGGGGPMGALAVADAAGMKNVLVPRLSAVFSAHGIGFSDIAHMSELKLDNNDAASLTEVLAQLKTRVSRDMFSEGFDIEECELQAWLLINGKEIELDLSSPSLSNSISNIDEVIAGMRAIKSVNRAKLPEKIDVDQHEPRIGAIRELMNADGSTQELPVINVEDQTPGATGVGPAVIEEAFWTCKVEAGWAYEFTINGDVLFKKID